VKDPEWMSGDTPYFCDDCGMRHDEEECAPEEDPDRLHDEMMEE